MLGKGRAEAITDLDMYRLAIRLDVPPENLEAIAKVESNGFGWFDDGRIKILVEKHWFYKLLPEDKRANASKSGLARKSWIAPKDGGYKDQNTPDERYKLLERMIRVDESAALQSISMGKFQIMGFNYALCGFKSPQDMWAQFLDSEVNQLRAFSTFLTKKGLTEAIRKGDFAKVEEVYNGGGLNGAYAKKMADEARKLAPKWRAYRPQQTFDGGSNEGIIGSPEKPVEAPKPISPAHTPKPAQNWLQFLLSAISALFRRTAP